jgi:hypothetical protein
MVLQKNNWHKFFGNDEHQILFKRIKRLLMKITFNVRNDTTKKKEILDGVRLDLFFKK